MEDNLENTEPIGELFGNVLYRTNEQLNDLIDNLDEEQAYIMMKFACEKALYAGIFTLPETEILLKSLRKTHKLG
jgi:hypothetical protein